MRGRRLFFFHGKNTKEEEDQTVAMAVVVGGCPRGGGVCVDGEKPGSGG